jgi:hypothetical protein
MCHVQHWIPYNGCINPYNQIVTMHKCWQFTQVMTESCASEVAAPTPLSRLKGGGTRCKQGGGEPRMESTQLTAIYLQYAREMSH